MTALSLGNASWSIVPTTAPLAGSIRNQPLAAMSWVRSRRTSVGFAISRNVIRAADTPATSFVPAGANRHRARFAASRNFSAYNGTLMLRSTRPMFRRELSSLMAASCFNASGLPSRKSRFSRSSRSRTGGR